MTIRKNISVEDYFMQKKDKEILASTDLHILLKVALKEILEKYNPKKGDLKINKRLLKKIKKERALLQTARI